MGEVWSAERLSGSGRVAVKVLLERVARKRDIVERFKREAKAAAMVKSPFVCALLDQGHTPEGALYLVFEYLEGESLSERLRRELFMSFAELAPLFEDVLVGISEAHAAGVLHRDLKPGNVFIRPTNDGTEQAVILDFGVSKIRDAAKSADEPSLTAYDGTVGSFAYMAPEQVRGAARVDERADVYGAGAVAFRALAGRLPFEGATAKMVVSLKMANQPPSLADVTGIRWPKMLEGFFIKALARNPAHRYGTASEALDAWRAVRQGILQACRNAVAEHWRPRGAGSCSAKR